MSEFLYHGTNNVFERFTASSRGMFGSGVYLTNCIDDAQQYCDEGKMPLIVSYTTSRPYRFNVESWHFDNGFTHPGEVLARELLDDEYVDKLVNDRDWDECFDNDITDYLIALGYDSIEVLWPIDSCPRLIHLVMFDKDQVMIHGIASE